MVEGRASWLGTGGETLASAGSSGPGLRRRRVRSVTSLLCALGLFAGAATGVMAQDVPAEVEALQAGNQEADGQFIADFALQFVGYPYVYAGNTPGGFDCSGFTQYVVSNTLGIDIGHGVAGQMNYGGWVDWEWWQAGDIVFFANTYAAGLSHVGIYIGDGQFVHAENEGTGVTISSLYSDYYAAHYAGAMRLV